MKKILCLLLTFALVIGMVGCSDESTKREEQEAKVLSEEEMAELKIKAKNYYNKAQFVEGVYTYQKLYDGGCKDEKYFGYGENYGIERALTARKYEAIICSVALSHVPYVISNLKSMLKDPNSLAIYNIEVVAESNCLTVELDYGAKNSFGGMVRDNYSQQCTFTDQEMEMLYEPVKFYTIEGVDITTEAIYDMSAFFVNLGSSEWGSAILNGTATYYK